MRLFPKDVESSLLFEELSLQTAATHRGRQLLPCHPGSHVWCRRVLAESAAGAQAGPHTCKHTHADQSYTHAGAAPSDIHTLSNTLRPHDKQQKACRLGLHAWQNNSDYVNVLRSSSLTKRQMPLWIRVSWEIRSRNRWNFWATQQV